MERGKEKVQDKEMGKVLDHIYQNALGNLIVMDTAPTKEQIKANTVVKHGSDIYFKTADNTVLKITGVEVT